MKIRELRQKPNEELERLIMSKRNHFLNLRFDLAQGRVKNIKAVREAKKDIARILTLLRQPKIGV